MPSHIYKSTTYVLENIPRHHNCHHVHLSYLTPHKALAVSFTDNLNYHLNFANILDGSVCSIYFMYEILVCFPKSDHISILAT